MRIYSLKKIKWVGHLASIGIIVILMLSQIQFLSGPVIMPDEVGYWAAGATFAGDDWSGVMQIAPYYGWGYGLVLSVFYRLFDNPVLMYKVAIAFNIVLLVGIYILCNCIIKAIKPKLNYWVRLVTAFTVTVYSYNIYSSMQTSPELFTAFIYICICVLFIHLCLNNSKHKNADVLLVAVLAGISVACHLRNLSLVIVLSMFIVILWLTKKISLKTVILYGISLLGIMLCFLYFKDFINEHLYRVGTYTADEASKVKGALGIFSVSGIKSFFKCMLGRIFYIGCATFLLAFRGIILVIRDGAREIRKNRWTVRDYDGLFIFKCFAVCVLFAEMALGALSFLGNSIRIDGYLYGRYSEHVIIPILILGIISFDEVKSNVKVQIGCSVLLAGLAIAFRYIYYTNKTLQTTMNTIVGIAGMPIFNNMTTENMQFLFSIGVCLFSLLVAWGIYFLMKSGKMKVKITGIIVIAFSWIMISFNLLQSEVYDFAEYNNDLVLFAEQVEDIADKDDTLFYMFDKAAEAQSTTSATWLAYRIRFFLKDADIEVIDTKDLKKQKYIIGYKPSIDEKKMKKKGYRLVLESERMSLYERKTKK